MTSRVIAKLMLVLDEYFREIDPRGEILPAPIDVTFSETTIVKPDIIYVSGQQRSIIRGNKIQGVPNLIVEVLSPSTGNKDEFKKLQVYLRAGVLHYWSVNPVARTLHCFSLKQGKYPVVAMGKDDDVVEHPDFAGLAIPLKCLWSNQ